MRGQTFLAICTALCVQCAWTCEAGEPHPIPRAFTANLGSYAFGTYSELKLKKNGVLIYKARDSEATVEVAPTPEQWRVFRKELDRLGVWKWRADYFDPATYDGTQWRIEIEYADEKLKTSGSNLWPDQDGVPRPTPEETKRWIEEVSSGKRRTVHTGPTEQFNRYVAAVEALLGGRPMQ